MSGRARVAAVVTLSLALAVGTASVSSYYLLRGGLNPPVVYVVERGDTLFLIARAHGVSIDDLRAWNGIEGDLIEVGQELRIFVPAPGTAEAAPANRPRRPMQPASVRARPGSERAPLAMPEPKACLKGPALEGTGDDVEMAASEGLDHGQISGAMNAFLPNVVPCISEADASPTGTLMLEIRVGCDGLVQQVEIGGAADWPPEVAACVQDTLRYAPFPAHALPEGDAFDFPLRFTPG